VQSTIKFDFRGSLPQTATTVLTTLMLLLAIVALAAQPAQAQAYAYSLLYGFAGPPADGRNAYGTVIKDGVGNLYGFTLYGGAGYGTVYKIDSFGHETVLHNFNLTDGSGPQGNPVMDTVGNLYGITGAGGALGNGTVFKLDTANNLTVLYNVPAQPRAGLVRDTAGNLYGTMYLGGTFGNGTVFKLDTLGNATVLHDFGSSPSDGILPAADLLLDPSGNLVGTTQNGGAFTYGTVFKVDTSGNTYSVLHSFNNTDGANPAGSLIPDTAGNLYGSTFNGGAGGFGALFKLDSASNVTVLHSFTGADGFHPSGDLVRDAAGNLYGTTAEGGGGQGTVFKLDTANNVTLLHVFAGPPTDGAEPIAGLYRDAGGNLYGTTIFGSVGPSNNGTVFKLTAAELNNFTAEVLECKKRHCTAVDGTFSPTTSIDPATQAVTLSVAGTNTFSITFPPGSFKKVHHAYVARGTSGSAKISMLLELRKNGTWFYSAAIRGFVPGSTSVTVSLTIGAQNGSATVTAHVFCGESSRERKRFGCEDERDSDEEAEHHSVGSSE